MPHYKIEAIPRPAALAVDATPDDPTEWQGLRVVQSVPGSPHMIVDVADPAELGKLAFEGVIKDDYRPAHDDYVGLGFPVTAPLGLATTPVVGDTYGLVGATEAVRQMGGYGAVKLGHVDTPVSATHPCFAGKTLTRARSVLPGPSDQHGTHTLGTAAGVTGIASDAELYTYPALIGGTGSEAEVANGIRWCADQGCHVMTLSLGGSPSQVIDAAVQYARQARCLVFSAAGNDGGNPTPGSPARSSNFIVLACDRSLVHASFTDGRNWDLPHRYYSQGVAILGPVPGGYVLMSGTSMATPHLAGLACLLNWAGVDTDSAVAAYFDAHLEPVT